MGDLIEAIVFYSMCFIGIVVIAGPLVVFSLYFAAWLSEILLGVTGLGEALCDG